MKSFTRVVTLRNAIGAQLRAILRKPKLFTMMVTLLAASPLCRAQVQAASLGSAIELARADMRSQRTEIITATIMASKVGPVRGVKFQGTFAVCAARDSMASEIG